MCAAAIGWTGIGEVVIGTDIGDNQRPWHQPNPHRLRDGAAGRAVLPR